MSPERSRTRPTPTDPEMTTDALRASVPERIRPQRRYRGTAPRGRSGRSSLSLSSQDSSTFDGSSGRLPSGAEPRSTAGMALIAPAGRSQLPARAQTRADEERDRHREPGHPDEGRGLDHVVEEMDGEEQVQTDRHEDQRQAATTTSRPRPAGAPRSGPPRSPDRGWRRQARARFSAKVASSSCPNRSRSLHPRPTPGRRPGHPPERARTSGRRRRHALAVGVAGLLVAREEVERVAVVGDLWVAVRAGGGRDDRSSRSAADRRLAGRPERRPVDCAGAGARALRPRVLRNR